MPSRTEAKGKVNNTITGPTIATRTLRRASGKSIQMNQRFEMYKLTLGTNHLQDLLPECDGVGVRHHRSVCQLFQLRKSNKNTA